MNNAIPKGIGLRKKLAHEIRQLLFIAAYLALFFLVFRLYTDLILEQYGVNYFEYGLTIVKALALAKIILTAEALHLGERFRAHPLIVPTIYNTIVFALFALVFEILEHILMGKIHGKTITEVLTGIANEGWPRLAGTTLVVLIAFLPFFAFRETERELGEARLRDLFFKSRGAGDL
jgi:hypothetical protein